jgi:hypothetical protein
MKTSITIALSLVFAAAAVRAQNLSAYQGVINGQSPYYYNTLDNTLAPATGMGTFGATAGATYASDYFGNASSAVTFATSTDQLSYGTGGNIISGSGTATPVGSLSLLFETPATFGSTMYLFSNSDTSGSQLAVTLLSGTLNVKINNKTFAAPTTGSAFPTLDASTWYYLALTWDCNGTVVGVNGFNYYLGQAGQASIVDVGFMQRGGTGNFSSSSGTIGNGGAFVLSGHQTSQTGGFTGGVVDELATWSYELSSDQVNSQFNALITSVPEPSAIALGGLGGLLALFQFRKQTRSR